MPPGLLEDARMGMDLAKPQARLIVPPAALPVTQAQACERKIVTSARMIRISRNSLPVGKQSIAHAANVQQRVTAVRSGGFAAKRFGAIKNADRLGTSALHVEKYAVRVDRLCVEGIVQKCPAQPGPGAGEILLCDAELAPGDKCFKLCWIQCECLAEVRLCPLRPALLATKNRQVDPAGNHVGAKLDGSIERGRRPQVLAVIAKQAAKTDPRCRKVRTKCQGSTVANLSFLRPAEPRKHETCRVFRFG